MSTPSTATATHPASHHPQRYGYSHHHSYQSTPSYPTSSASATAAANTAARLPTSSYPYAINPPAPAPAPAPTPTTAMTSAPTTAAALPYAQSPKILPPPPSATPATMASTHTGMSAGATPTQNGRRKKTDWGEFYKNGIPKEVIVIDDTPPPDQNHASASKGPSTSSHNLAASSAVPTPNGSILHPAGKKRRTGMDTAYDVGYYDRPSYSINPQHYGEDSSAASISTDRTTSLHTTAPTSLGSHGSSGGGSNGVYYDDANIGQKRKRVTTRKSTRDEQKRRELEAVGDAFLSYVPPPNPPIKAKDVAVPVIRDVSPIVPPLMRYRFSTDHSTVRTSERKVRR